MSIFVTEAKKIQEQNASHIRHFSDVETLAIHLHKSIRIETLNTNSIKTLLYDMIIKNKPIQIIN